MMQLSPLVVFLCLCLFGILIFDRNAARTFGSQKADVEKKKKMFITGSIVVTIYVVEDS